ncbi:MAG: hypothetical protein KA257_10890 [Opitutaceae bacterium]|nr:hypothetical protein [Opitutaceae bacterium]
MDDQGQRQTAGKDPVLPATPSGKDRVIVAQRIRLGVLLMLQAVMAIELLLLLHEQLWISSAWLLAIMAVTSAPLIFSRRLPVRIPLEYEVMAILFVFASLFLGEFRSYYERFWWWDIALHGTSGLLLGILGFLLVYVLNESKGIEVHMRPAFVALFAFMFAVSVGTFWEIFEFGMDQLFGTTMQKPMLGDPSGLTDTMWDLILDVLGATAICCFGWWNMKRNARPFLDKSIQRLYASEPPPSE